jgi:hypothetical protein
MPGIVSLVRLVENRFQDTGGRDILDTFMVAAVNRFVKMKFGSE